ncbi:hypothetical protein B0H13DRAFT_2561173 [Mycena leptocephala]|nr:hypothetical protein B0H13DRAFT_2561173 [Mycena leptocephala]
MNLRPNPLHPHVYVPSPTSNLQNSIQYAKRLELLHPFFMPVLLGVIRIPDDEDATRYSKMLILPSRLPSSAFLASLSAQEHATLLRAYLIVYSLSRGKMVPHQGQLESSLAAMPGRESIVIARTGYGKTLCIAIPLLLQPGTVTLTISPLKRLQHMQAQDFVRKYGIPTVAINEDTPDSVLYDKSKIEAGEIPHLIVQPEQFRLTHGHLPRMAKLLHNQSPHYHSDMSPEYLEMAYNDFANPDGTVLILHATSGAGEISAALFSATSCKMVYAFAATRPVNSSGVQPAITEEQLWKGLEYKARNPVPFVPVMSSSKTTFEEGNKLVRELTVTTASSTTIMKEEIESYAATIMYFEINTGLRITHTISYGPNDELLLTYTFSNWTAPGAAPDEPKPSAKELNEIVGRALDRA